MAILRVGGKVEGRTRPMPNPHTITGYPRWNTYAPLDMPSAVTEIRKGVQSLGVKVGSGAGRKAKKLDPSNICHRMRPGDTRRTHMENLFNQARVLSLQMDRLTGVGLDMATTKWGACIAELLYNRQDHHIDKLIKLEMARGVTRAILARRKPPQTRVLPCPPKLVLPTLDKRNRPSGEELPYRVLHKMRHG